MSVDRKNIREFCAAELMCIMMANEREREKRMARARESIGDGVVELFERIG